MNDISTSISEFCRVFFIYILSLEINIEMCKIHTVLYMFFTNLLTRENSNKENLVQFSFIQGSVNIIHY